MENPAWQRGTLVPVSLADATRPLTRSARIEELAPRGTA